MYNTLDFCGAVVTVLEGVAGEPAVVDVGPDCDFYDALSEPAAYKHMYGQHGTHHLDGNLMRQKTDAPASESE